MTKNENNGIIHEPGKYYFLIHNLLNKDQLRYTIPCYMLTEDKQFLRFYDEKYNQVKRIPLIAVEIYERENTLPKDKRERKLQLAIDKLGENNEDTSRNRNI